MKTNIRKIMAAAITAATIAGTLTSAPVYAEDNSPKNSTEAVEQMGLGFNLGKTFNCNLSGRKNIENLKARVDAAYKAGFNTIRIPVRWTDHMDDDGNIIEDDETRMVKEIVDYCEDKDLYVILGSMNDLGEEENSRWDLSDVLDNDFKKEYRNMWSDIADIFEENDYHVVFEPYNEIKNIKGETESYGYGYKNKDDNPYFDSYYFAGRCGNLKYVMSLNKEFASIMKDVAPDKFYMVGSYNADPRSAYTNYFNDTWQNWNDQYVNYDTYGGEWWKTFWMPKGVDQDKAIYFCHIYKYGDDFTNEVERLQKKFKADGIKLPIYVDENGCHRDNMLQEGYINGLVKNVKYMTETRKSGLALWDDTQSMSFMNFGTWDWHNEDLISAMIETAGQSAREEITKEPVPYTVTYRMQNKYDLRGYDVVEEETLYGEPSSVVEVEPKEYEGYETPENASLEITPDGEANVVFDYKLKEYHIYFECNGGTLEDRGCVKNNSMLATYLLEFGRNLPTPVREGYTFAGWIANEELNGSPVPYYATMDAHDLTLYARWEKDASNNSDEAVNDEFLEDESSDDLVITE